MQLTPAEFQAPRALSPVAVALVPYGVQTWNKSEVREIPRPRELVRSAKLEGRWSEIRREDLDHTDLLPDYEWREADTRQMLCLTDLDLW
jgi:hypothetical protein